MNPPRINPGRTFPLAPPRIHFVPDLDATHTRCGQARIERGTLDWAAVTCERCVRAHLAVQQTQQRRALEEHGGGITGRVEVVV